MDNSFTVLFDFDSMIYKAVHKIVNIKTIRSWFADGKSKAWMKIEIINLTINRVDQMSNNILMDIELTDIQIESVEYFLTTCSKSIRKAASPIYKANRKKNKWVSLVRQELLKMEGFIYHDEYEADDLIKERAVEIGVDNYVICSVDKDLKQIEGIHFDYWRPVLKNPDGSLQVNEYGHRIIAPCRGLDIITAKQANHFFWKQMLMGDSGDNIKGIPRIGKVKAEKILSDSVNHEETVKEKYVNHFGEEEGRIQFDLHRLLIGLGIENRP